MASNRRPTAADRARLERQAAAQSQHEEKNQQPEQKEAEQQQDRVTVNLLVLGVYNTIITTYGNRPDMLSPAILKLVAEHPGNNGFDAFLLCTNRAYILDDVIKNAWAKKAGQVNAYGTSYTVDEINSHIKINQIVADFKKASGLKKCLEISSAEDELSDHIGDGYNSAIRPGEVPYAIRDTAPAAHIDYNQLNQGGDYKNHQLLRVAQLAKKKYPKADIQLTFVDDGVSICNKAFMTYANPAKTKYTGIRLEADPVALPANVSLRVFQHTAKLNQRPDLIAVPKGAPVAVVAAPAAAAPAPVAHLVQRPVSALRANNLFPVAERKSTGALTLPGHDATEHTHKKRRVGG